jgi:anthranilate synthase component 2
MSVLIIDNYDSFTYNLVHLVEKIVSDEVVVRLNDKINMDEIPAYERIILSPGPGIPSEAGIMNEIIKTYSGKIPMLGVCLGHQALAEAHGATLLNLNHVYHGVATPVTVIQNDALFNNMPRTFEAGRYHSWVVEKPLPAGFNIIAEDANGYVMAFCNQKKMLYGVQFHPESILTTYGEQMIANWLNTRWQ